MAAVLRWRCCRSRWTGLFGSVARWFLDTDSPQCLQTLVKDKRSIFFVCGLFSFVTFRHRHPRTLITLQRSSCTAGQSERATVLQNDLLHVAEGYTPPRPGTASRSRRWCTASSPPPQTAGWCCLSSWRESACEKTQLCMSDVPPSRPRSPPDRWHHCLVA